ncbi:DUF881 domain-containing protein [Candidatus Peregrinibacteria bacterium]|nr:DUF881 domain-containing protein [Candidatus Peregrinibacteria bacterium]
MYLKQILVTACAIILGLLLVFQGRSYSNIDALMIRDSRTNVFQEIKVLKGKNEDLKKEVEDNELTLEQLKDQNLALEAIEENINKYKLLSGKFPVFGPGITISLEGDITAPWAIDLINELFNAGAEAVSINGIRITNHSKGIDMIPNGQFLMNGSILNSPYIINAIGESDTILSAIEIPGGIFDRLSAAFPELKIEVGVKEIIQMN